MHTVCACLTLTNGRFQKTVNNGKKVNNCKKNMHKSAKKYAKICNDPTLFDSKGISRALLRSAAVCNWLFPVCSPLLSGANQCKLSARSQRERRKRYILDSQLRALEPLRLPLGLGSHGRVRRLYSAPEDFQVPANRVDFTESVLPIGLELGRKSLKRR